nr:hypothetical protein [Tanacetum cinerariifolium]
TYTSVYTDSEPGRVFWGTDEEPLPPVDSPTAESPGYVAESDPEEDPEYEDDEEQDGPDEDIEEDEEEEEEEEHVASADSTGVILIVELVSSPEGIKPALTDAVTATLPSSSVDRRDEIPESKRPPRKRCCLFTIGYRYEAGESSTTRPIGGQGTDYGFVSIVDFEARRQGIRDVGVVEIAELHEHDIQDFHALLEDAQDGRSRISQRVNKNSQQVDLLMGDKMTLQETVWTIEEEAYAARVAWNHSIGLSQATYQELQTHRAHVYAHETHDIC